MSQVKPSFSGSFTDEAIYAAVCRTMPDITIGQTNRVAELLEELRNALDVSGQYRPEAGEIQDRKQSCDAYTERYPADEWDSDIHIIVSDYNFEDGWLFDAIAKIATKLSGDRQNADLRRRLFLLVELLKLPMPSGWNDEDAI